MINEYIFYFVGGGSLTEKISVQRLEHAIYDLNTNDPDNDPEPLITETGRIIILNNVTYIEKVGNK